MVLSWVTSRRRNRAALATPSQKRPWSSRPSMTYYTKMPWHVCRDISESRKLLSKKSAPLSLGSIEMTMGPALRQLKLWARPSARQLAKLQLSVSTSRQNTNKSAKMRSRKRQIEVNLTLSARLSLRQMLIGREISVPVAAWALWVAIGLKVTQVLHEAWSCMKITIG